MLNNIVDNSSEQKLSDAKSELLKKLLKKNSIDILENSKNLSEGILSSTQQRLYYVQKLNPDSGFYNVPVVFDFNTKIDPSRFQKSISHLAKKHKILRTSYHKDQSSQLIQKVNDDYEVDFKYIDFSNVEEEKVDSNIKDFILNETAKSLILEKPPIRYFLIKNSDDKYIFLFIAHHILIDGWSIEILLTDLKEFYENEGKTYSVVEEKYSYLDFALWEKEYFASVEFKNSINYWKNKLEGSIEPIDLPKDFIRKNESSHNGNNIVRYISSQQLEKINLLVKKYKSTNFIFFYTCLTFLFHKLTSKSDIIIGTQVANRKLSSFNEIAGYFANTIVLKSSLEENQLFSNLLETCSSTVLDAYAHQHVPFEKIVEMKGIKRDLSINPIFQVMFVYQVSKIKELKIDGGGVKPIDYHNGTSKFDLDISISESSDGAMITFEYDSELFKKESIERFLDCFFNIIHKDNLMDSKICDIDILETEEKLKITSEWNSTKTEFANPNMPIHKFIEKWEKNNPNADAILQSDKKISRIELSKKANQIAWWIINMNLGNRPPIGVCLDRSVNMVSSLLGIVKSGSPYLPIDPILPIDRIEFMVRDSQVPIIITSSEYVDKFKKTDAIILNLDDFSWDEKTENPNVAVKASDLLYIIYTSGTSGKPKGVMLNHKGRVNNFFDFINRFNIVEQDRLLSISALSFDMTAFDIFGTLASGAAIVLPNTSEERDPEKWYWLMNKFNVSIWHSAPSLLKLLVEKMESGLCEFSLNLRLVLLGGDWIPLDLQERLSIFNCKMQYISLGGATEVSMDSTIYEVEKTEVHWNSIPYGRPMANQRAYVVDSYGFPVPVGVAGELCLGGMGVGYGYLNQSRLTAEKFIPDPYGISGARMYRTGDLARFNSDGILELLGRIDSQIKIDGYRIETGEIESLIKHFQNIDTSVVSVCKDKNGKDKLVAFYTIKNTSDINTDEMRRYLADNVPYYMVPIFFVELDEIPLSSNGKVIRKSLPNPLLTQNTIKEIVLPETNNELILCKVWSNILNINIESVMDDFFELGGDSIKAIQIVAEIKKLGYRVELKDIIKYPKIKELADIIVQERDVNLLPITGEQLYLLATNQYLAVSKVQIDFPSSIEKDQIVQWLNDLVHKIDTFKLSISDENDSWQQFYSEAAAEVVFIEQNFVPDEKQLESIKKTFNFGKPFPLHAINIKTSDDEKNRLFIVIPQLFVDKNSINVIKKLLLGFSSNSFVIEQSEKTFSLIAECRRQNNSDELIDFFRNAKKFHKETTLHENQIKKLLELNNSSKRIGYLNRIDSEENSLLRIGCCESFYWNNIESDIEVIFVLEGNFKKKFLNIYVSSEILEADKIASKYYDSLEDLNRMPTIRDYPPTPMQNHMIKQLLERSITGLYTIQCGFFIPGIFNKEAFIKTYEHIIERFEILRSYFIIDKTNEPRIAFASKVDVPLTELDWSNYSEEEVVIKIDKLSKEVRSQKFNIGEAPLWRIFLIKINEELTLFLHFNCYALLDGWSMQLLISELFESYQRLIMGMPISLKCEPFRFSDCCEIIADLDKKIHTNYWESKIGKIDFETSFGNSLEISENCSLDNFRQKDFFLDQSLTKRLVDISLATHLTKTVLITYAWGQMMKKLTQRQKVLIGVTMSGRSLDILGVDNVPGLFINTMPIELDFSESTESDEIIEGLQKDLTDANGKEQIPLCELKKVLNRENSKDLFDVILVFDNYPVDVSINDNDEIVQDHPYKRMNLSIAQTEFPLRVDVWLEGNTRLIMSWYQQKFSEVEIDSLFDEFSQVLDEYLSSLEKQNNNIIKV